MEKRGGENKGRKKEVGQKLFQVESSINPRDPGTITFCGRKSPVLCTVMGPFLSEIHGGAMTNKMKGFPGLCS